MNKEEIKKWLTEKVLAMKTPGLQQTCLKLLADERFFTAPAAAKKHQAWDGGLAEHTQQVMDIALSMAHCDSLKHEMHVDEVYSYEIIAAAALWHDYGKIWDYKKAEEPKDGLNYVYDRHRWTVRHLVRSYSEFMNTARSCGVSEETIEEISHCILAHHGRSEWGSPVEPLSPEASILHYADCMSAFHIGKQHVFRNGVKNWGTAKGE